jgi:hypothetical protein
LTGVTFLGLGFFEVGAAEPSLNANSTIRGNTTDSEIVIRTTARLAGAIDSLTWRGREFINSTDHGRQLQSASNFDAGSPITAETFNPTEAGSRRDGAGQTSTSQLLHLMTTEHQLQSTSRMAFWLAPGEKSDGNPAKNTQLLSNHLLTKRVRIGLAEMSNVIQYDVTFSIPIGEHHKVAVFEALTGYMPADFQIFKKYDRSTGQLEPLDDGPGEQNFPVVISTADGAYAMGIYTSEGPRAGMADAGYGRFRFPVEKVVKWNCVFRVNSNFEIEPGEYSFRMFVTVGDLTMVNDSMRKLHREFPVRSNAL